MAEGREQNQCAGGDRGAQGGDTQEGTRGRTAAQQMGTEEVPGPAWSGWGCTAGAKAKWGGQEVGAVQHKEGSKEQRGRQGQT